MGSRTFRVLLIAFILYLVVSHFLVATFRVESVSMEPEVSPADRVMVSLLAFGPLVPFSHSRFPGLGAAGARGHGHRPAAFLRR